MLPLFSDANIMRIALVKDDQVKLKYVSVAMTARGRIVSQHMQPGSSSTIRGLVVGVTMWWWPS